MRQSGGERYITVLGELEVLIAFQLRVFRKEISENQALASLHDFEKDLADGILLLRPLSEQIFQVPQLFFELIPHCRTVHKGGPTGPELCRGFS